MPKIVANGAARPPAAEWGGTPLDDIEAAITCCAQAREAARNGRLDAAQRLLQTALSMHRQAERTLQRTANSLIASRFNRLVNDMCYSAQVIEVEEIARHIIGPRHTEGDS